MAISKRGLSVISTPSGARFVSSSDNKTLESVGLLPKPNIPQTKNIGGGGRGKPKEIETPVISGQEVKETLGTINKALEGTPETGGVPFVGVIGKGFEKFTGGISSFIGSKNIQQARSELMTGRPDNFLQRNVREFGDIPVSSGTTREIGVSLFVAPGFSGKPFSSLFEPRTIFTQAKPTPTTRFLGKSQPTITPGGDLLISQNTGITRITPARYRQDVSIADELFGFYPEPTLISKRAETRVRTVTPIVINPQGQIKTGFGAVERGSRTGYFAIGGKVQKAEFGNLANIQKDIVKSITKQKGGFIGFGKETEVFQTDIGIRKFFGGVGKQTQRSTGIGFTRRIKTGVESPEFFNIAIGQKDISRGLLGRKTSFSEGILKVLTPKDTGSEITRIISGGGGRSGFKGFDIGKTEVLTKVQTTKEQATATKALFSSFESLVKKTSTGSSSLLKQIGKQNVKLGQVFGLGGINTSRSVSSLQNLQITKDTTRQFLPPINVSDFFQPQAPRGRGRQDQPFPEPFSPSFPPLDILQEISPPVNFFEPRPRASRRFGFLGVDFPPIGFEFPKIKVPKGRRTLRRTTSLVSIELGLTSPRQLLGEETGLIARPILTKRRKRR